MNGGIIAIRGFLFQYLICILDSFENNWSSVIIEPTDTEDKVDILWIYKNNYRVVKNAVQVKSTKNNFGGGVIKIADGLKNFCKDADSYKLVLIGQVNEPLLKYIEEGKKDGVEIPHPKVFDPTAFKGQACHMMDQYLDENYGTQLPWKHLENIVFSLIGELQFYTTNKQEVTRDDFENKLRHWVESYVNPIDRELQENQDFKRLYGFEATPSLRFAINQFYRKSRKIRKNFFKWSQNFLDVDIESKALKVIYPSVEIVLFRFFLIMLLVVLVPTIASLFFLVYFNHWIFYAIFLMFSLCIVTYFIPLLRPYIIAKQIDKEIEKLKDISRREYRR
jgi:predicted secreted protein